MQNRLMEVVEKTTLKPSTPKFEIGDTVDVHVRILEGDKERIQIYNGVVIARSGQRASRDVRGPAHRPGRGCRAQVSRSSRRGSPTSSSSGRARSAAPSSTTCANARARRSGSRSGSAARTTTEAKAAKAERRKARAAKKEKVAAST